MLRVVIIVGQAIRGLLPLVPVAALPEGKRFLVIAASTVQAPGATGSDHRLHRCMELVSWEFVAVVVPDVQSGDTLTHCALGPGAGVGAERGSAQPPGMSAAVQQGAELIVQLSPPSAPCGVPRRGSRWRGEPPGSVRAWTHSVPCRWCAGRRAASTQCGAGGRSIA